MLSVNSSHTEQFIRRHRSKAWQEALTELRSSHQLGDPDRVRHNKSPLQDASETYCTPHRLRGDRGSVVFDKGALPLPLSLRDQTNRWFQIKTEACPRSTFQSKKVNT